MEELTPSPTWHDSARVGMGQVRLFSERVNLAELTPHDALASTSYCLAKPGLEYVVLNRSSVAVTVSSAGSDNIYNVSSQGSAGSQTTISVSAGAKVMLCDDGTYWLMSN